MRTPAPDVLAFLEQVAAADGRRQAAVDVEGQRPLLHDILAVLAGFLEHAADPRLEQVPVDEQLSAGLRTAQPVAAERDFVAAVVEQRPLLHDILAVLAVFLEHAADPRLEQVPVDEQLSAGLRTAQPVAAERDFVAAVVRGAAARADVLAAREDAAH